MPLLTVAFTRNDKKKQNIQIKRKTIIMMVGWFADEDKRNNKWINKQTNEMQNTLIHISKKRINERKTSSSCK